MPEFSPAFRKWFGASKVVDSHGKPLVVYHGTNVSFSKFDLSKVGTKTDSGWYGKGFYFAVKPEWGSNFSKDSEFRSGGSGIVYSVFLSIQNPMIVQAYAERGGNLVGAAKSRGYDGLIVVFDAGHEEAGQIAEIVAFYPEQIKSVDNDGTWDVDDPDIRSNPASYPEPMGWWIDPSGGTHELTEMRDHDEWAREEQGRSREELIADGWIRLNAVPRKDIVDGMLVSADMRAVEDKFLELLVMAMLKLHLTQGKLIIDAPPAEAILNIDVSEFLVNPRKAIYRSRQIRENTGDRAPMLTEDRETLENPSWVDKIVKQHCAALEAYAQAHGLPMPVLENCKPAKEFGCGHYGCVMPTSDPGIVFKITSDESEAHFIGCYMKLRDQLPFDELKDSGIVDYKAIVGLKESSRRARRVYAVWREEAQNVGVWAKGWQSYLFAKSPNQYENRDQAWENEWSYFERQTRVVNFMAHTFKDDAADFRRKAKTMKDRAEYFKSIAEAWKNRHAADDLIYDAEGKFQRMAPAWVKGVKRLSFYLRLCDISAELLAQEYLGDRLGKTLGFFLDKGLLLADVHGGNLGTRGTDKEAIITDPGHLVILKPEWEQIDIEAI